MKKVLLSFMLLFSTSVFTTGVEQADLVGCTLIKSPIPNQNYILVVNYHDVVIECVMKFSNNGGAYLFKVKPKAISEPIPILKTDAFKFMCLKLPTI